MWRVFLSALLISATFAAAAREGEETTWRAGDRASVSLICPDPNQAVEIAELPAVQFGAWIRSSAAVGCRVREYGQRQIPIVVAGYSSGPYYDGAAVWSVWAVMAIDTGELAFAALDDSAGRHETWTGL